MKRIVFLMVCMVPSFVYSMHDDNSMQKNVLLLQSRQQVRQNNAREVAAAFKSFFEVILPLYPALDKNECDKFVKIMEKSEISRGKKRKMLPWLEMGIKNPWALQVVDRMDVDEKKMDANKKLPKRRRIG